MESVIFLLLFKLAYMSSHNTSVSEGAMEWHSEELLGGGYKLAKRFFLADSLEVPRALKHLCPLNNN